MFSVRANRAFLARAVRFLAAEAEIRQFLDVGTGIPTADNTHEVAQRVAPESRIVYVDNDPIVLSHAKALLTSKPEGVCAYLDADRRCGPTSPADPSGSRAGGSQAGASAFVASPLGSGEAAERRSVALFAGFLELLGELPVMLADPFVGAVEGMPAHIRAEPARRTVPRRASSACLAGLIPLLENIVPVA